MTAALVVLGLFVVILALLLVFFARTRATGHAHLKSAPGLTEDMLADLSVSTAVKGDESPDAKQVALLCAGETAPAQTYISHVFLKDPRITELEPHGFIRVDWQMEHAKPDRYHVLESAWGQLGFQYHEWVTIGPAHYESTNLWAASPPDKRAAWNQALRADKFLAILSSQEPRSADLYRYRGVPYYLLTYELSSLDGFGPLAESLPAPYEIRAWVHRGTGLLARGDVIAAADGNSPARPELTQVFTHYNEAVQIAVPQTETSPEEPPV